MPIGKNAIKRVENNGYSKVQTSAPDMENSHVIANVDEQVMEKMVKPVEKATKAKTAKKCQSSVQEEVAVAAEKPVAKKTASKKAAPEKTKNDGFAYVNVGADMPYYLL